MHSTWWIVMVLTELVAHDFRCVGTTRAPIDTDRYPLEQQFSNSYSSTSSHGQYVTPVVPGAMTPNQDGSPSPSPEVQEAVKKKRKRSGGQELEGRLQIGQAKTIEKRPNFV